MHREVEVSVRKGGSLFPLQASEKLGEERADIVWGHFDPKWFGLFLILRTDGFSDTAAPRHRVSRFFHPGEGRGHPGAGQRGWTLHALS